MPEREATSIIQLKVRMREPLRAQLEQAANGTGHSMNAEIVERLERSFERQDLADEFLTVAYGRRLAGLLTVLGRTMNDAGQHAGFRETRKAEGASNWLENAHAYDQATRAVTTIIEAFRPKGDPSPKVKFKDEELENIFATLGEGFAQTNLRAVATPEKGTTVELKEWGQKVHDMLGPLISVIKSRLNSPDKMEVKS